MRALIVFVVCSLSCSLSVLAEDEPATTPTATPPSEAPAETPTPETPTPETPTPTPTPAATPTPAPSPAAPSPAAPKKETRRLVVLDLSSDGSIAAETARLVQDTLTVSFAKKPSLEVLSSEDIRRIVSLEAEKELLGCSQSSCLAELASAMGADLVAYGSVGSLGTLTVINLSLFDSEAQRSLGRETIEAETREEIPRRVRAAVDVLAAAAAGEATVIVDDEPGLLSRGWFWAGAGGTVVGAAALGAGAWYVDRQLRILSDAKAPAVDRNVGRQRGLAGAGVALGGGVVAVAGVSALVVAFTE